MGGKASYIWLSEWGSPLSPTYTRFTWDQQPAPANTNLPYHQNIKRNREFLQQTVLFSKMQNARRNKRPIGENVVSREKLLAKITDQTSWKTFYYWRGQKGGRQTLFDEGSRVWLDTFRFVLIVKPYCSILFHLNPSYLILPYACTQNFILKKW